MMFGSGRGLSQPHINTLVTEVAPEGRLGGVASVNNIARYARQMASPFLLGIIRAQASFQMVFLASEIIGAGTSLIALIIKFMKD